MSRSYVYGDNDGRLIFIELGLAQRLKNLRSGFANWGEAHAALEQETWDDIVATLSNADEDVPGDDETFDLDFIPGYEDGDWPEWPAELMLDALPKEVVEKYGRVDDSVLNGQFLTLPTRFEDAIVRDLQALGWQCVRSDALVLKASGF